MRIPLFSIYMTALMAAAPALADEVHLMNGRTMEGLVTEEGDETVTLDVGIGTVKLHRYEILSIDKSEPQEAEELRMNWVEKRLEDEVRPSAPLYRTRSPWGRK